MQNKSQAVPNTVLLFSSDNSNLSVSQFGVFTYGFSDIICNIFHIEVSEDLSSNSAFSNQIGNSNVNADYTRTIDDTAWKALIENEVNKTYNKLNNYFINRNITPKNEYTGIFEGKNLIVILMESTNEIFINEKEYPTLYKLYTEGFSFRNNYKVLSCWCH